jgi:hypothetical protein
MLIALEGFGSIWSVRARASSKRTAYYNTTGITVGGGLHHRSRVYGHLRFNEAGGFNPKHIERNIGRVFESVGSLDQRGGKLLLHHLSFEPKAPDYFSFAVKSERTGKLTIDSAVWKRDDVLLLSLSEARDEQEAILLMPPHSWIRGSLGLFVAEPRPDFPWRAFLRLLG